MLLTPRPTHIATRGRLGGQYAIATRGYLVLPDFVARVPAAADMAPADLWARAEPSPYGQGWIAEPIIQGVVNGLDYDGFLKQIVWQAVLEARGEQTAELSGAAMVAQVDEGGEKTAEVDECPDPTATVESVGEYEAEVIAECAIGAVADARDKKGCK